MTRKFDGDRLLVATHNKGKLEEMAHLLEPFGVTVVGAARWTCRNRKRPRTPSSATPGSRPMPPPRPPACPPCRTIPGSLSTRWTARRASYTADWAETGNGRDFLMAMTRAHTELEAETPPIPAPRSSAARWFWPGPTDMMRCSKVSPRAIWSGRSAAIRRIWL